MTDFERGAKAGLEAAPHDTAENLAGLVTEWVDGATRAGTDWRPGLARMIRLRLARLAKWPLPSEHRYIDPASGGSAAVFKPCRVDLVDSNMTQWAFEDVANFARPAFPGLYHFIDEICAMEDGRLVGIQFWGPPPKDAREQSLELSDAVVSAYEARKQSGELYRTAEHLIAARDAKIAALRAEIASLTFARDAALELIKRQGETNSLIEAKAEGMCEARDIASEAFGWADFSSKLEARIEAMRARSAAK
jgi:hypothetical protein